MNNRKFTDDVIETVEEKMKRKHQILNRGCSMIRSLVEMSKNGTSFERLCNVNTRSLQEALS